MWRAGCPTGEVCSSFALQGLTFYGASFGATPTTIILDRSVKPVATGGLQTIRFDDVATRMAPTFPSTARFDSNLSTVVSSDMASVLARAVTPGTSHLRIEDASGRYVDSVEVRSAPIASAAFNDRSEGRGWRFVGPPGSSTAYAIRTGASVRLEIAIRDAASTRMVDESMAISGACPSVTVQREAWDLNTLVAVAAGTCALTFQAGGTSQWNLAVTTADSPDAIAVLASESEVDLSPTTVLPLSVARNVCFVATIGSLPMLGVSWTVELSSNVQRVATFTGPNCVSLLGTSTGPATVTVRASGFSRTFPIAVGP